jgi:hypothetical protein
MDLDFEDRCRLAPLQSLTGPAGQALVEALVRKFGLKTLMDSFEEIKSAQERHCPDLRWSIQAEVKETFECGVPLIPVLTKCCETKNAGGKFALSFESPVFETQISSCAECGGEGGGMGFVGFDFNGAGTFMPCQTCGGSGSVESRIMTSPPKVHYSGE